MMRVENQQSSRTDGRVFIALGYFVPICVTAADALYMHGDRPGILGRFGGAAGLIFTLVPALVLGSLLMSIGTALCIGAVRANPSGTRRSDKCFIAIGTPGALTLIGLASYWLLNVVGIVG